MNGATKPQPFPSSHADLRPVRRHLSRAQLAGIRLNEDPIALECAALKHVEVEINLSGNFHFTSVPTSHAHPYLKYLRLGLPVSLCTDDGRNLEIDINHECQVAVEETDVTYFDTLRQ